MTTREIYHLTFSKIRRVEWLKKQRLGTVVELMDITILQMINGHAAENAYTSFRLARGFEK